MSTKLHVLIAGQHAGFVSQADDGALSFGYDAGYDGAPLSFSMPISNKLYKDKQIRPYLFGLLPDDQGLRRS